MDESEGSKRTAEIEAYLENFKCEFWKSVREPKFVLEILGFIVLAIYAVFTGFMYFANRNSADAARDAALAAKQSADTQEHSFQMEKRRAEDQEEAICTLHADGMAPREHFYHIYVVNAGKVNARSIEAHVDVSLNDASSLKKIRNLGSADISTSELAGDKSMDHALSLPLTEKDWDRIADTEMVIIGIGHVRYENGFGRVADDPYCEGWWYFRTPDDKNNPIQGRGSTCDKIPQNVAGIKNRKP